MSTFEKLEEAKGIQKTRGIVGVTPAWETEGKEHIDARDSVKNMHI